MTEAKVRELMEIEWDYGHLEESEAREIVEEAIAKYEDDPEYYDNLDEAIEMVAHDYLYPEV